MINSPRARARDRAQFQHDASLVVIVLAIVVKGLRPATGQAVA